MKPDPIIKEVRKARHRISSEFGHDTTRLAEHYKQLDEELRKTGEYKFVTGFFSTEPTTTNGQKKK